MYRDCVRLDEHNRVIGHCTWQDIMDGVRHRVVWGLVYHPGAQRWAVQWRRPDKGIAPLKWDMSAAGHVDWVDGATESYRKAYARELGEELGLTTAYVDDLPQACAGPPDGIDSVTLDLGHKLHEIDSLVAGGERRLLREVPGRFLTLYAGDLSLPPDQEPLGLAWMTTTEARDILIAPGLATFGLAHMLDLCAPIVTQMGIHDSD